MCAVHFAWQFVEGTVIVSESHESNFRSRPICHSFCLFFSISCGTILGTESPLWAAAMPARPTLTPLSPPCGRCTRAAACRNSSARSCASPARVSAPQIPSWPAPTPKRRLPPRDSLLRTSAWALLIPCRRSSTLGSSAWTLCTCWRASPARTTGSRSLRWRRPAQARFQLSERGGW